MRLRNEPGRRWRIVLAEDQPLVRAGVRKVLEAEPDFTVVAEAEDGDQLLRVLRDRRSRRRRARPQHAGSRRVRGAARTAGHGVCRCGCWCSACTPTRSTSAAPCATAPTAICSRTPRSRTCRAPFARWCGPRLLQPARPAGADRGAAQRRRGGAVHAADAARARGPQARRGGAVVEGDRRGAEHQPAHRRDPSRQHHAQAEPQVGRRRDAFRDGKGAHSAGMTTASSGLPAQVRRHGIWPGPADSRVSLGPLGVPRHSSTCTRRIFRTLPNSAGGLFGRFCGHETHAGSRSHCSRSRGPVFAAADSADLGDGLAGDRRPTLPRHSRHGDHAAAAST